MNLKAFISQLIEFYRNDIEVLKQTTKFIGALGNTGSVPLSDVF